jgi:hypothetical protein
MQAVNQEGGRSGVSVGRAEDRVEFKVQADADDVIVSSRTAGAVDQKCGVPGFVVEWSKMEENVPICATASSGFDTNRREAVWRSSQVQGPRQLQTLRRKYGRKMVLKLNWESKWTPTEMKQKRELANFNETKRKKGQYYIRE